MIGACATIFLAYSSHGDENTPVIVLGFLLVIAVVIIVFISKEASAANDGLRGLRAKVGEGDDLIKKAAIECDATRSRTASECARLVREAQDAANKIVADAAKKSNELIEKRMLIADTKIKAREEQLQRVNAEYWEKRDEIEMCKHVKHATHTIMYGAIEAVRTEFGGKALRYLADGYAQALISMRDEVWYFLDATKLTKADERRRAERERRLQSEKELCFVSGLVAMYETAAPWLMDLREPLLSVRVSSGGDQQEDVDEARAWLQYLSDDEWERMSVTERNQLALDRYLQNRKSNVEIGRDYEQFVGWKYEQEGWTVQYHGMVEGVEDLGRDLICKKENVIQIVQCKCWNKLKSVRECHVNQLFGTFVEYAKANKCRTDFYDFSGGRSSVRAVAVFVTTTTLSPVAEKFAAALGIVVRRDVVLGDFPRIKCNIGKEGEKIYHLPFDQQYNTTVIERSKGEFYAWRTDEAETQGFRRARKHFLQQA